jgi:hypothetical protein
VLCRMVSIRASETSAVHRERRRREREFLAQIFASGDQASNASAIPRSKKVGGQATL